MTDHHPSCFIRLGSGTTQVVQVFPQHVLGPSSNWYPITTSPGLGVCLGGKILIPWIGSGLRGSGKHPPFFFGAAFALLYLSLDPI